MAATLTVLSVAASSAGVVLGALPLLALPRKAPLSTGRTLLAAVVALLALAAALTVTMLDQRFFLAINVLYCAVALSLPLLGLFVLLSTRWRTVSRGSLVLAGLTLFPLPLFAWATFVEPYRLEVVHTTVPIAAERAPERPLTIAVLADIQCVEITDHERSAVNAAMEARPDLILLPGDFVQVGRHRLGEIGPSFRALIAELQAPLGVYCVQGDCESVEDLRTLFAGTHVRFLDDEVVHLEHAGRRIALGGVRLWSETPRARRVLASMEEEHADTPELRLVVAHRPDVVLQLPIPTRVDLLIAGHTHGGQVQLPFVGPPLVLSRIPRSIGAGGLHEVDGRRLYVSRGIGWEHGHAPRVRLGCRPEVSILTLVGARD